MDQNYAKYLLAETRKNYDKTAEDYARTRAFVPDDLKRLGDYADSGDRILDSGCANGRFFEVLRDKKIDFYGIDFSEKLIGIARKKYPQGNFKVSDALKTSFADSYFDKVYSISVLHNVPSRRLQIQYLREMRRVMKPGGLLVMRVWDFWKRKEGWRLFAKYAFLKLLGKSKLDIFDVFVPWKDSQGKTVVQRYFHCFTERNIVSLVREAGLKVKKVWRDGKDPRTNIYIVAEK
jgi:tRNA (uracil-5-)-methyltransferase TRM9